MNHGSARLPDLPLSVRLIKEIHEHLLDGIRGRNLQPSELRRSQNWISPQGSTLMTATFVPPPHQEAASALGELEKFLHQHDHIPPLVKIGLAHAQFETIHPFLDGNGRIGRLLITFFLCQQGILQKPVLYLSHFFKQNRTEYYERLQKIRDEGEWEDWLKFFLKGVASVASQATETARQIVDLREQHRTWITNNFGSAGANGARLLEHLYKRPRISVNAVKSFLGISYPNANNLVEKFRNSGILFEVTGNARNRQFLYTPYIDLFSKF
jgi:Fic family protein